MQIFNIKYKSKGYISLRKKEEERERIQPSIYRGQKVTRFFAFQSFRFQIVLSLSVSFASTRREEDGGLRNIQQRRLTSRGWRDRYKTTSLSARCQ